MLIIITVISVSLLGVAVIVTAVLVCHYRRRIESMKGMVRYYRMHYSSTRLTANTYRIITRYCHDVRPSVRLSVCDGRAL